MVVPGLELVSPKKIGDAIAASRPSMLDLTCRIPEGDEIIHVSHYSDALIFITKFGRTRVFPDPIFAEHLYV